jgi:2-polyprenyl-3-methyl-5-hydroxy-6-metoxy-1,4-benzoquinol methylase
MNVFGNYAHYYNLLYRDKNYAGEARFIHDVIQRHAPASRTVLDLGCGTGIHDEHLARLGYRVHGVDMSAPMIEEAQRRTTRGRPDSVSAVTFSHGDIRHLRMDRPFDVVVSLFHVMSYQTSNDDIRQALTTAKAHLNPGGVFIFDFWYGPAVLTEEPEVRVKRMENEYVSVVRVAEPLTHFNDNVVDVVYQLIITDKSTGISEFLTETHAMRYYFKPELDLLLDGLKFECIEFSEWMTGREPGKDTWGVYCVVRL